MVLASLSLYCDLCLTLLDNKYFDRFRSLTEMEIATSSSNDWSSLIGIFLLFKRISGSTKTEYSEKLLDLTEQMLSRVNMRVQEQSADQLKLSTICVSIVTDLLEVN